MSKLVLFISKT